MNPHIHQSVINTPAKAASWPDMVAEVALGPQLQAVYPTRDEKTRAGHHPGGSGGELPLALVLWASCVFQQHFSPTAPSLQTSREPDRANGILFLTWETSLREAEGLPYCHTASQWQR